MAPRRRVKILYPCSCCGKECDSNVIECSTCGHWVHIECIPMSTDMFRKWAGDDDLKFSCPPCVCPSGTLNYETLLDMLKQSIPDTSKLQKTAKSIQLLCDTYPKAKYDVKAVPMEDLDITPDMRDNVAKRLFNASILC